MEHLLYERVYLKVEKNIAWVAMDRPEKYNGLDYPMLEGLVEAAKRIKALSEIRAVILHGKGRAFCSGLDVSAMLRKPHLVGKLLAKQAGRPENLVQRAALAWRALPVPVIAVTHGYCLGGGFQIALGADFRFSTPGCKFSILETKWGLIPDMGATVLLRELISIDLAKHLTMTGDVFSGAEAESMNLVTKVCEDPMAAAVALAQDIAERSPDAVAGAKKLYNEAWLADDATALAWETKLQKRLIGGWNQIAAASKNFLRRPLPYRMLKSFEW